MTAMTNRASRRSPLAMTVLLLLQEQPMHPYGLRQLIVQWNKDRVVNVTQRYAIYQVIDRLLRSGLISIKETARNDRRPERTVYETTPEGRDVAHRWLLEMLAVPATEYPEYPAALAYLQMLDFETSKRVFTERKAALEERITSMDEDVAAALQAIPGDVPRIYLVEIEYMRKMLDAELSWVSGILADLTSGALVWSNEPGDPSGAPGWEEEQAEQEAAT
jgi:DNA-binding PadR family transcriptional regulator